MLKKIAIAPSQEVKWDGEVVATVHSLSPADIAGLLATIGNDIGAMFDVAEEVDKMKMLGNNPEELADRLMSEWPKLVAVVGKHFPDFIAHLIAIAAKQPDDWKMVRDDYSFVLQFEILVEIAKLTFVTPEAFGRFMGNVLALVDLSGTLTSGARKRPSPSTVQPSSDVGSITSSPSSRSSKRKAK